MKKIIIYISFIIVFASCENDLESEFHNIDKDELYSTWSLEEVEINSSNYSYVIPTYEVNTLQLNEGGTYLIDDPEGMILLNPVDFEYGLWEFPIESAPEEILFDKGVSTYDEIGFYLDYTYYQVLNNPIDLFEFELDNGDLNLISTSYEKNYNYSFRYFYDYISYYMIVDEFSTYEDGYFWGEEIGYYTGISDAAIDAVGPESQEFIDNAIIIGLGDAANEYYYNFIDGVDFNNPEFEAGFYDGFFNTYDEGTNFNFIESGEGEQLILKFTN